MIKTAIVTGSTGGIGLGVAEALAANGMQVMLNGFGDIDEIKEIQGRLAGKHGVDIRYHRADMMKPSEIRDMVDQTERALGSVDVLVNNVGIQHVAPVEELPEDKWEQIVAINLSSAFYTTRAVLGGMKSRRWGRIINIASTHGLVASPFKAAYVAAKHGLVGFTKAVALETAQHGITANAICPGYVRTSLVENQIPDISAAHGIPENEAIRDIILAVQPTKEFVKIEEIGALAVHLCSNFAASITGAAIAIDGGWTSQ